MAKTTVKDVFAQRMCASLTLAAAADSENYEAFTDAYKPEDLKAWIIHRAEYEFEESVLTALDALNDRIKFGLSFLITQPTGGMEIDDPGVLDHNSLRCYHTDAVREEFHHLKEPIIKDFSGLPGGGLLVHPVNLYLWAYNDQVIANTLDLHCMIHYTLIDITDAIHKELWQAIYIRQA